MRIPVLAILLAVLALCVKPSFAATGTDHQEAGAVETPQSHRDDDGHDHGPDDEHAHAEEAEEHEAEAEHAEKKEDHGAEHDHGDEHEEGQEVHLSVEQQETLGIKIQHLTPQLLGDELNAPGEVRLNAYATALVIPRIAAQVLARHARLGETVSGGQPLVTLTSVEMAEAQGELVVTDRESRRVRKLGKKVVSDRRYMEARVARQQARSKVIAYGMQPTQVDALLRAGTEMADGSFQLLSSQAGTVVQDDFILGELVEPGRVLFEITDEHIRWVQARLSPQDAARVSVDDQVRVRYGDTWLEGRVIQIHHALDESTRTQAVRIEVPDPEHRLHPGVFVDVSVSTGAKESVLALPKSAVLRSPDGDWQVFVAGDEDGVFEPMEVEVVRTTAGLAVIRGLPAGTEVVTHGAFFLQSELAKSGFDIHNH